MRTIQALLPVWVGLAVLVATPVMAADAETPPPEAAPEWSFTAEPFFWAAGLEGDAGVHGLGPVNVNIDFDQIFNHIDWWPPPIMERMLPSRSEPPTTPAAAAAAVPRNEPPPPPIGGCGAP